ncbi:hypothetical protein FHT00_001856 [Sphingomonas insulae]|uniref:DUF3037 domain-containing protein n=1 Tax=Sphingomonas insulae TaxID=424800 RepID=A0ABP3T063_9SPHN|nr:DUF3037 domain-containing protein [Sphingomonas insulae]NIJ29909.1 hypothetical protein [Sphingomonas insulae]
MATIFNYAVVQAVPDRRRGERVNIGLMIFGPDGVELRISETRKLAVLAAGSWDADIDAFASAVEALDDPSLEARERMDRVSLVENQFTSTSRGWFEARKPAEYEKMVGEIVDTLVARRRAPRSRDGSTVVAEISAELRGAEILAGRDDELRSGKVIRNFRVADGLEADFAQLNGQFHVAAVLDLRANSPRLAQAALKAVVLDRAQSVVPDYRVHKIGVFAAAPARLGELHDNLAILKPYADELVNWEDPSDRRELKRIFFDAYNSHSPTPLGH